MCLKNDEANQQCCLKLKCQVFTLSIATVALYSWLLSLSLTNHVVMCHNQIMFSPSSTEPDQVTIDFIKRNLASWPVLADTEAPRRAEAFKGGAFVLIPFLACKRCERNMHLEDFPGSKVDFPVDPDIIEIDCPTCQQPEFLLCHVITLYPKEKQGTLPFEVKIIPYAVYNPEKDIHADLCLDQLEISQKETIVLYGEARFHKELAKKLLGTPLSALDSVKFIMCHANLVFNLVYWGKTKEIYFLLHRMLQTVFMNFCIADKQNFESQTPQLGKYDDLKVEEPTETKVNLNQLILEKAKESEKEPALPELEDEQKCIEQHLENLTLSSTEQQ